MKKKIVKWGLGAMGLGLMVAATTVYYLFNQSHRDVQAASVDYRMTDRALVAEYLSDADRANDKYLQEDGESRIIAISGTVASVDEDMNHQRVVLLRSPGQEAGVSCTFMAQTNANAARLRPGDRVTVKGVIRAGAGYDEDLELYEDVIMEKCDVLNARSS